MLFHREAIKQTKNWLFMEFFVRGWGGLGPINNFEAHFCAPKFIELLKKTECYGYFWTLFLKGLYQSAANSFSDGQIQIWILFAKRHILWIQILILFLTSCVTNMIKNNVFKKYSQIYLNFQIYSNIWKSSNLRLLLPTSLKIVDITFYQCKLIEKFNFWIIVF